MSKLEKSLIRWTAQGLINQTQADNIKQYEDSHAGNSWILYGCLILGSIIIGIGAISLIAANWNNISDTIKLAADFFTLFVLSVFIVKAWSEEKPIQFEILLLTFMLFTLASIGLISQIYHTNGEFYQALMLWSLITFPLTLFTRKSLIYMVIPFMWLGGFLIGLVSTLILSPTYYPLFQGDFIPIAMSIPLFCASLLFLARLLNFESGYITALRFWLYCSGMIAIVVAELAHDPIISSSPYFLTAYGPGYFLALVTAGGIVTSSYKLSQKIVLLLALALYLLSFMVFVSFVDSSLIPAIFTIVILGLIAIFSASEHQQRLFNLLLLFIGVRFLILYFQALGGLAMTGIGLIISGILIITMTICWNKYKTDIAKWTARWMK